MLNLVGVEKREKTEGLVCLDEALLNTTAQPRLVRKASVSALFEAPQFPNSHGGEHSYMIDSDVQTIKVKFSG